MVSTMLCAFAGSREDALLAQPAHDPRQICYSGVGVGGALGELAVKDCLMSEEVA